MISNTTLLNLVMTTNTSVASSQETQFSSAPTSRARRLVMGNWKMNGSLQTNQALLGELRELYDRTCGSDLVVCVPAPYLAQTQQLLDGTPITWGGQDVSAHDKGAYTGEVSAAMLSEFGSRWALVGHSERRTLHGETDQVVADKALAALRGGLTPVVCVGESLQERDQGQVAEVIERQLKPVLALGDEAIARLVIAYEPVWAIGTGRSATPEQAREVHALIRKLVGDAGKNVPLLYGGSVKPDNAGELFAMDNIDGALVGGASLVATEFYAIAN